MARRSKMSFQKREREKKKQEKAALKRELKSQKEDEPKEGDSQVATADDLAGYGFDEAGEAEESEESETS